MIKELARRSRRAMIASVGYGIALFWVNHIPLSGVNLGVNGDKVAHFGAYAGLAFLVAWTVYPERRGRLRGYLTVLGCVIVYGALDELFQALVPGRHADWWDWVADIVGAIIGIGVHVTFANTIGRVRRAILSPATE